MKTFMIKYLIIFIISILAINCTGTLKRAASKNYISKNKNSFLFNNTTLLMNEKNNIIILRDTIRNDVTRVNKNDYLNNYIRKTAKFIRDKNTGVNFSYWTLGITGFAIGAGGTIVTGLNEGDASKHAGIIFSAIGGVVSGIIALTQLQSQSATLGTCLFEISGCEEEFKILFPQEYILSDDSTFISFQHKYLNKIATNKCPVPVD